MKATGVFPDGFRTGQILDRQIVQSGSHAFTSYCMLSPVCRCPISAREPSGSGSLFRFESAGLQQARPTRPLKPVG